MKGRPLDTEPAEFGEIARRLKHHYGAQRVWLFGSRAKGTADEDSDIDLLVVSPVSEGFFQRMASVRRLLRDCRAGGPISPIVLTPQELQTRIEKGDQFIGDILANGVEL